MDKYTYLKCIVKWWESPQSKAKRRDYSPCRGPTQMATIDREAESLEPADSSARNEDEA